MSSEHEYSLDDLLGVMERLRDPVGGCPWDLKQTFQTIVPSTLEECYELIDTIEREDYVHLEEELGDFLFQVIIYSQLGKEESLFDFHSITSKITAKLVRRHPHVFAQGVYDPNQAVEAPSPEGPQDDEAVKERWEEIKVQERKEKTLNGVLDDVPLALPAVLRAMKLQKRAAKVGFDWPNAVGVIDKIKEETAELEAAIASGDSQEISGEIGDLLFCCINLARHLKQEPEVSLRSTNQKFENRFRYVEAQLQARGQTPEVASLALMDELWDEAKSRGL